ncbi:DNA-binding CsgD family transcriptional regulator [Pedobacter sp. AK013]|uniref:helix-turn-helix transcriptional regulator n=1 Tax=Pedobacter sp. AK013 TaxID=2723071 RepID=UPI00160952FD|nr:response regulator transcription factor [Pedobacter sp. AK013]MBB6236542.1 DNA-binding CsgD family transcriptional regulator [Pedobacter sp. AK013]
MNATILPAGINGRGAEFFSNGDENLALYQREFLSVENFPPYLRNKFVSFFKMNPAADNAYEKMVGKDLNSKIYKCISCMFAIFDNTPDVDEKGGLVPEFVECHKRGVCSFEGEGCLARVDNSAKLSPAQQRVLPLIHLSNREIADKLCLSVFTIQTHIQSIQKVTGKRNKKELIMHFSGFNLN